MVVLVDDLDRCDPVAALSVLEGIKLFLGNEHTAFVIALDFDSLLEALRALHPRDSYYRLNYLEKLIQVARYVPTPDRDRLRRGIESMSGLEMTEPLWRLVDAASQGNPRRAKRFVNTLLLAGPAYRGDSDSRLDYLRLAKLLVFRVQFPTFYASLVGDPALWEDLERHLALADDGDHSSRSPSPRLEPFLADQRLRQFLTTTSPESSVDFPRPPNEERLAALIADAAKYVQGFLARGDGGADRGI